MTHGLFLFLFASQMFLPQMIQNETSVLICETCLPVGKVRGGIFAEGKIRSGSNYVTD
jgi:hypothetical protein